MRIELWQVAMFVGFIIAALAVWVGVLEGRHPGRVASWWKKYVQKKDNNGGDVPPPA